ncbi:TniQ family protein [Nonomuraea basaltis]|uniref:TniQ family protein n=1 Tax=Nonomuraea basaltis TaxID=2495887 RepID=UPI00110C46BE|nr:TniQ family protein [Nonomuraea basaltis]TMR88173.1 TniQ family protein [Nonomuraea basaltis]
MAVWPRRLALVVAPVSGESFASWVDRMAVRNGCPPWTIVESLGLDVRAVSGDVRSLAYGIVATPEVHLAIAAVTGVGAETVRELHLDVFNGSAVDLAGVRVGDKESLRRAEAREWAQFFGSRACSECLATSGGAWQVWWKLGWAAVCPIHRVLLMDHCPTCRVRIRRGPAGQPRGLSRTRVPTPLQCGAILSGGVCDQSIPQIRPSAVSNELVHAQQMMLEVATRRRPALIAGQVVNAGQWFAALKAVAMLVRLGMPDVLPLLDAMSPDGRRAVAAEALGHRWNRAGSAGRFGMLPQTALVAAGLLAVAIEVVAVEGESELATRLKSLAAAARIRWNGRRPDPLAELDLPSVFAAALDAMPRRGRRS